VLKKQKHQNKKQKGVAVWSGTGNAFKKTWEWRVRRLEEWGHGSTTMMLCLQRG